MRSTKMMALCALALVPLLAGGTSANAGNNDYVGQAQRFLNNNNSDDRSAYERGRDDEMRRQQAQGQRNDYRRDDYDRDRSRDDRPRQPDYGYNRR